MAERTVINPVDMTYYLVGGVNSPVRAFKEIGISPILMESAYGARFRDINGKEYIDYCMGWGSLILGHRHPAVTEKVSEVLSKSPSPGITTFFEGILAKLIAECVPSIEKARFTNSGTEAVLTAIRLARGYTKKKKIIKFRECYHGSIDYFLKKSTGIIKEVLDSVVEVPYNDLEAFEKIIITEKNIACVIIEPVAGNYGLILPHERFLEKIRLLTLENEILLIFDEVITGFRLALGGAQSYFNIIPDLTCLGKIIGGGFPIGAVGGKQKIMDQLTPEGDVFHAGTFAGHPISMIAGIATIQYLKENQPYKNLEALTEKLCSKLPVPTKKIGSMFSLETKYFNMLYTEWVKHGVYFSPSVREVNFLSVVHTEDIIEETILRLNRRNS